MSTQKEIESRTYLSKLSRQLEPILDRHKFTQKRNRLKNSIEWTAAENGLAERTQIKLTFDLESGNPPGHIEYIRTITPYGNAYENQRLCCDIENNIRPYAKIVELDSVAMSYNSFIFMFSNVELSGHFHPDKFKDITKVLEITEDMIDLRLKDIGPNQMPITPKNIANAIAKRK